MNGETKQSFVDRHQSTFKSINRGWRRFKRHRLGIIGVIILTSMVFIGIFAPFLAPHSPEWRAPDTVGEGEAETLGDLADAEIRHPAGPTFGDPYFAPLGTDHRGHDVLTHLMYGSRITLYIGFVAALLSSLVGIPLGIISGYYGDSWIDEGIQRFIDIMYALPFLPLMIVIVTIFGVTVTNVILAIVVKAWLINAIVIRGQTLSLKERSYIEAAKVAGASDRRIMLKHILPNVLPLGFIYLAQDAAIAIIAYANLAFLGYAPAEALSWGTMLQWVQVTGNIFDAPWWMLPPGILITLVAASFYFIGYSLEDVTNPHTGNQ